MTNIPSAFFVSTCDTSPVDIIEKVLDGNLPDCRSINENISAYHWDIDNKYYTASINLCSVTSKEINLHSFEDVVEAIIIYFDSACVEGLELSESWLSLLSIFDPEIKILVCQNCVEEDNLHNDKVSKRSAQEWCIQHGFELVELEPCLDDIDPDDDFQETTGVERIRQALNAHRWPNLSLKSGNGIADELYAAANHIGGINFSDDLEDILMSDHDNEEIPDFATLYSQLSEVKERISHLSEDARIEAAEKIVFDLIRAMHNDTEDND